MAQRPAEQQRPALTFPCARISVPSRMVAGGEGSLGCPIGVAVNHFRIITDQPAFLHRYKVEIKFFRSSRPIDEILFRKILGQFIQEHEIFHEIFSAFFYKDDLYTGSRDPIKQRKVKFEHLPDEFVFINLSPFPPISIDASDPAWTELIKSGSSFKSPDSVLAMDSALKYSAIQSYAVINDSMFSKPLGKTEDLGGGIVAGFGHFQSLRIGFNPFLNVDTTQCAFLKSGKLHELMAAMYERNPGDRLSDSEYADFNEKITDSMVMYDRGRYTVTVRCNGIKGPATEEKVDCDGEMVFVQEYYATKLRMKLHYPDLPCLSVGSDGWKTLVPMEACCIVEGQNYRYKLSDVQKSAMCRVAATTADVRKQKILESLDRMHFDDDPYAEMIGISVDSKMILIQGRVLPMPVVVYGEGESSTMMVPKDGVWNMRDMKFIDPKALNHFGLINTTECTDHECDSFMASLISTALEMGMLMTEALFNRACQPQDLEMTMTAARKEFPRLQILIIIIKCTGDRSDETAKRVGDLDMNIPTQCVEEHSVLSNGFEKVAKICLEINAKLGGINFKLSRDSRPKVLLQEPVLILAACLNHPSASKQDSGKPSVAAVVGTFDPWGSYCCEISIQKKDFFIQKMDVMMINLLRKFKKKKNIDASVGRPLRIIYYRYGAMEDDYEKVQTKELACMLKACRKLSMHARITFIMVRKRHHTLFFPQDKSDEVGLWKNVPPGLVIDKTIVHPVEQDFFLVSHKGIQGTSRPTHYHVLWDDSKFPANDIQILTYYMCYLFTRCNRPVSYPAPCYYSHLVAVRGRQYYDNLIADGRTAASAQASINKIRGLDFMTV